MGALCTSIPDHADDVRELADENKGYGRTAKELARKPPPINRLRRFWRDLEGPP